VQESSLTDSTRHAPSSWLITSQPHRRRRRGGQEPLCQWALHVIVRELAVTEELSASSSKIAGVRGGRFTWFASEFPTIVLPHLVDGDPEIAATLLADRASFRRAAEAAREPVESSPARTAASSIPTCTGAGAAVQVGAPPDRASSRRHSRRPARWQPG
jgi:hypothetical protein